MTQPRRGLCLVLASPSGGGKTTMMQRLLIADPGLVRSVSATTRASRSGEQEGVDYFFRTREEFDALVDAGGMLEHATVFGKSYGIPHQPVEDALAAGMDVTFVIDWQGHLALQKALPDDVVGVFLEPPTMEELERRMIARGDLPEDVEIRMKAASGEMSHRDDFEHVVLNKDFDQAFEDVQQVLQLARISRLESSMRLG